jgi:CDP-glucose 4,6-dehydratase
MGKDYSSGMEISLGQRLRELPGPLLLTGHTGFKGTWMTFLLEHLNIPVVGYSLPAERGSLFDRGKRTGAIPEAFSDIRNYEALEQFIDLHKPSTIIHMAAQPLVLKSYENPRETFDINVMGTVNVLDIAFKKDYLQAVEIVTTDKVYKNDDSGHAFIETDALQGKDPYSASKVGTEAVVSAWQQIGRVFGGPRVLSVRSGNVIGGGDFAENRIIPDLIRGVMTGKTVEIRNPQSIRPWQHVLDPLVGYLQSLEYVLEDEINSSINFGPSTERLTVAEICALSVVFWREQGNELKIQEILQEEKEVESRILELNSAFANKTLNWKIVWNSSRALVETLDWWNQVINFGRAPSELVKSDIQKYLIELRSC